MPKVQLQLQHVIFTRVERAYSPRNSSGYQIVYQSPGLGSETREIEKRLQCFEISRQTKDRFQFFWTEKEQAVLAKSIPLLQPDPDVIDQAQRDAFLAHALVVSKADFAAVWNDPFAIFSKAQQERIFAEEEDQLVRYLRENEPVKNLSTPTRTGKNVSQWLDNWPPEELLKLYRLGVQAPVLRRQKRSLLLLAEDSDDITCLLDAILMLLPPDERAACTFDTCVDGCSPEAGAFWATGSSKGKSNPGFLPIRLVEQRLEIKGDGDGFLDPKGLACLAYMERSTDDYKGSVEVDNICLAGQVV